MSDTQPQAAPQGTPPLALNVQYTKDLSFEVPNAPQIYATLRSAPAVQVNLDVQIRRLQEGQSVFEVTIAIRAEATTTPPPQDGQGQNGQGQPAAGQGEAPQTVFIAELSYAGIFTLTGVPENQVEPVLAVECPRLLFPFARNILADVTRDGSFPPVLLGPIDFVALWQARRAQAGAGPAVANA